MRIKVNGIHINYELTGSGEPLVLIHGFGGGLASWAKHVPVFARHYRVLVWDQRGFGQSDRPGDYSLKPFASDLHLLLNALEIDRAFILGTSWGGILAQRFTLDYPEMVKALVITSSSSEVSEKAAKEIEARAEMAEKGEAESLVDAKAAAGVHRAVAGLYRNPMTPELKKITCPTLIMGADKDVVAGVAGSVVIHRNIPGSKLVIVQNCGHSIGTDRPEVFYSTILDFLASAKG